MLRLWGNASPTILAACMVSVTSQRLLVSGGIIAVHNRRHEIQVHKMLQQQLKHNYRRLKLLQSMYYEDDKNELDARTRTLVAVRQSFHTCDQYARMRRCFGQLSRPSGLPKLNAPKSVDTKDRSIEAVDPLCLSCAFFSTKEARARVDLRGTLLGNLICVLPNTLAQHPFMLQNTRKSRIILSRTGGRKLKIPRSLRPSSRPHRQTSSLNHVKNRAKRSSELIPKTGSSNPHDV